VTGGEKGEDPYINRRRGKITLRFRQSQNPTTGVAPARGEQNREKRGHSGQQCRNQNEPLAAENSIQYGTAGGRVLEVLSEGKRQDAEAVLRRVMRGTAGWRLKGEEGDEKGGHFTSE